MRTRARSVVGRAHQMRELADVLDRAHEGQGGTAFVLGEPGIGKSRLVQSFSALAADRGSVVLRGRAAAQGTPEPFRPLTEALLTLARRGDADEVVAGLGPYRNVLGGLVPDWGGAHVVRPGVVVLGEALLRLLARLGADAPALLVLEDLHDADADTLATVEYLADNLDEAPVVVVATLRGDPGPARDLVHAVARLRPSPVVELARLEREDNDLLVRGCLTLRSGPAAQVPTEVLDRLWEDSDGLPFVVEELLQDAVDSGHLVAEGSSWRVVDDLATGVPRSVVHSIAHRIEQLGPQARQLLGIAAILGHRFALSVVKETAGIDDRALLATLRAGVAAQIVGPDEPGPDWYAFRHPLTAEALLADLTPAARAELATRAADAVERLVPELPDPWLALVADLRESAGDRVAAGHLFHRGGKRALAAGAVRSAVSLLTRADDLLAADGGVQVRATVLEELVSALAESGQFERAVALADRIGELQRGGLAGPRAGALHARVAAAGDLDGEWDLARHHIELATDLLGENPSDEDAAPVLATAAHLALSLPGPRRLEIAAERAERAAAAAERVPLPLVASESLQLLGVLARERDLTEATAYFRRAEAIAREHGLAIAQVYSQVLIAGTTYLEDGSIEAMERARDAAMEVGAMPLTFTANGIIGMHAVLTAQYQRAAELVEANLRLVGRADVGQNRSYVLTTQGVLAAHRGDRRGMEEAFEQLARHGAGTAYERSLAHGLGRTFCALAEEDLDQAVREQAQVLAATSENPTTFHVDGRSGMNLLLGVLTGRSGWAHHELVAASASGGMRWNRQFVELAEAVLLGRDGRVAEATAALGDASAAFPTAHHLGRRLVAEDAHRDGWGDPVGWLREAEGYFHDLDVAPVASACRGLLRRFGATVRQRRDGSDLIPDTLRRVGVTAREHEVGVLLAEGLDNQGVAARLFISPRTVEKHVASLILKTEQPDRRSLREHLRSEAC